VQDSGLKETEIDEIALVGGSTCVPKAPQLTKDLQRQEPDSPDEVRLWTRSRSTMTQNEENKFEKRQ